MERLEQDDEKWLSAFTFYQFRDDGRLGLEITDPNNSDVGIEQPMMQMYKEKIQSPFFSAKMESGEEVSLQLHRPYHAQDRRQRGERIEVYRACQRARQRAP